MALDTDDLEPAKKKAPVKDLASLSVAELQNYIATLEAEIERARATIEAKQAHRNAADSLFKR